MKNYKRKFLITALISALVVSAFSGCSKKKEESESIDESVLKQPISFNFDAGKDNDTADGEDLNAADPTDAAESSGSESSESGNESSEGDIEYIEVTEADGQPVTTYIVVTDDKGQPATDSKGETQTTAVKVTSTVKNNSNGNSSNSGQSETTTASGNSGSSSSDYVSKTKSAYAMWLDISENKDFVFNDEFIQITFRIKEDTPEGVYDVNISNPDFASLADNVKSVLPDTVINGKVYVSENAEPQREVTDSDGFCVYADNVSAKPGDEVTLTFSMKNNPGLCAINFWFDYDQNAMEIVKGEAVGDFGDIANETSFGSPKK